MFSGETLVQRRSCVGSVHVRSADEERDHTIDEIPAGVVIPHVIDTDRTQHIVDRCRRMVCEQVGQDRKCNEPGAQTNERQIPCPASQPSPIRGKR